MGSSLFAGISGLASSGKQLDVIANNIANVNTVGFKSGKIHFGDILSQSITGGSAAGMQVGRGVDVAAITTQFSSGSFETTANATDLAIDGSGFFIVKDAEGGEYYTRAGAFNLDNEGYLVDVNVFKVQGYNLAGSDPDTISDISLSGVQSIPEATTTISIGANLDATTITEETFNASQTVYDSLGAIHSLKLTFTKTATAGEWGVNFDLSDLGEATIIPADGDTTILFTGDGELHEDEIDIDITFGGGDLPGGATIGDADGKVLWDLEGTTAEKVTGYASTSVIRTLVHDGYSSGSLKSISVTAGGTISGFFTNGQTAPVAQIVLADFANTGGLKRMGKNLFATTVESGAAVPNTPGSAGMGDISPNSLEMSNTDIATEFINMITAQRAYQASAKIVTVTDQMMAELMNIKR